MTAAHDKPRSIGQDDWVSVDVPEATDAEFARAVSFAEAHPQFRDTIAPATKKARPIDGKGRISFRLSSDVVGGIRATGPGYSRRVEKVLRRALAAGDLSTD